MILTKWFGSTINILRAAVKIAFEINKLNENIYGCPCTGYLISMHIRAH